MLLRPSEVKNYYKLSHTTLLELEKSGTIKPVKTPKGHRRYKKDDIDKLMESNVKDSIGYVMEIYFDNFQAMPETIEIVGHAKPSREMCGVFWGKNTVDPDKIPLLDLGTYRRIEHDKIETGWRINGHPRIRSIIASSVPRTVILKGEIQTGTQIKRDKFCNFTKKSDETILLYMNDLLGYIGFNEDRVSDELPCFFTSMDMVYNLEENIYWLQPFHYELVEARW